MYNDAGFDHERWVARSTRPSWPAPSRFWWNTLGTAAECAEWVAMYRAGCHRMPANLNALNGSPPCARRTQGPAALSRAGPPPALLRVLPLGMRPAVISLRRGPAAWSARARALSDRVRSPGRIRLGSPGLLSLCCPGRIRLGGKPASHAPVGLHAGPGISTTVPGPPGPGTSTTVWCVLLRVSVVARTGPEARYQSTPGPVYSAWSAHARRRRGRPGLHRCTVTQGDGSPLARAMKLARRCQHRASPRA